MCSVDDCDRPVYGRGLCNLHYQRVRAAAKPMCTVEGCTRKQRILSLGLCRTHSYPQCTVEGCNKARRTPNGKYCPMHQNRLDRLGFLGEPDARIGARGLGHLNRDGYRVIANPDGSGRRILEHRYVMEHLLGRPLSADETVHHINGDRADNRPQNLELWSTSQPPGQRIPDKVAHALEILRRYAPEYLGGDSQMTA